MSKESRQLPRQNSMKPAGAEKAKAKNLGSDADLKDLTFLEQESGVHQAREKEKIELKAKHDKETKQLVNNKPKEN